jgi:hypothetical protein
LALSGAELRLSPDPVPVTLTVDGDLAEIWPLPGLDTQTLAVQHATITYRQPSAGAAVTADLSIKAALTVGADTVGLTGTLGLRSELALSWLAGAPGGILSLSDAMLMATDGRSPFPQPAGLDLFAAMSLSSAVVSLSYAGDWTTIDFTLAADPSAIWNIGPSSLKQVGATFTAAYSLLPEAFQISFGGKIFATFDLEQEFGVVVGLSPSHVWEVDLTAERGLPALESLAALMGADDEVRNGLAAVGLGDITLTAVRIGVNRTDNSLAFLIMQGSIPVAGTPFDVYLQLPNFAFGATLPSGATIGLGALLGLVLGETGGLPDIVVSELALTAAPRYGSYSVTIAIADHDIVVGSYGLVGATISLAKQGADGAGAIGGTISLAGAKVLVEGAYSAGWTVSGQVDQLSLPALITEVLPDVELPAELAGLTLPQLSATWNITNGDFAFSGELDLDLALGPRALTSKLLFSVNSTVDPKTAARTTAGSLTGAVTLGPMTFNLRYDFTPGRKVLTGTWNNVGRADIPTLASAFGLAVPPLDVPPTGLTLTSISFDVDWAATGEQAVLLSVATTAGAAFFLVERPAPAQGWGFVFGLAVAGARRLSQVTALVGLDATELDFITIDSAYLLVSSAAFPALTVPGFAALTGITPSGAGVFAGVRLDFGLTPARPDVTALKALLASRPPVLQAEVALSRDPRGLAVTVKLDGSLKITGAGRSALALTDVSLVLKPQPVALTLHGSMAIPVGDATFTATGFLTAGDSGVTAAFNIAGTGGNALPSPFGLKGVHLSNIGVEIAVTTEPPSVAAGLLGRFTIGPGLPPPAGPPVPSRALAAMPPPGEFALILGLEGDLPNPLLLSMFLPELSVDKAVEAFTNQPAQNLPPVLRDLSVRDLMLYWCDAPAGLQLPDGTWARPGFGFNATLDLYGFRLHGALKIDPAGITGDACMDPVHVQGVIDVTGRGAGTPATYLGQATVKAGGPDLRVSTLASPYLAVDWQVVLFGTAAQTVNAEVTRSGFTFSVTNAGPGYSSALSATLRLPGHLELAFSVLLNLDLDLGVVNGVHLGQVHVANTSMAASLVASASPDLTILVNGAFSFEGTSYTMPQLSVNVPFKGLADLPRRIFDQLKNETTTVFAELRTSADAYLELAHKGVVKAGTDLGSVLRGAFQQTANQAAAAMKTAGYQINEIGAALQRGYGATAQQAAATLKQAGYAVGEVAAALRTAYGLAADQAASALKQAGYAAGEIADALKTAYGTAADKAAQFLKEAGFTVSQVAGALSVGYGIAVEQIAQLLKQAGYSFDDIGVALHADFGLSPDQLAAVLRSIGDGADQVGNLLKELFGLGPTDLGGLLRAIGYAADEVKQFFEELGHEFEEAVKHLDPTTW